ncbi:MAG: hypothetical protein Fur007_20770 [Rhodoferax sp.]
MLTFQLGRMIGYGCLGGLAAASMQGLGWLTVQSAALRPVWSMFHVAMVVLGLLLMVKAQQPVWLEALGRRIWASAKTLAVGRGRGAPLLVGMLWAFLPCGLLYSALLVAGLAGRPLDGMVVMVLFALGTSVSMTLGPWLWLRLRGNGSGDWGVRLAGLALALSSGWALWMALAHDSAPWCTTV